MLDIIYRFTCGDSDLSEIIEKCQNIMTTIVALKNILFKYPDEIHPGGFPGK